MDTSWFLTINAILAGVFAIIILLIFVYIIYRIVSKNKHYHVFYHELLGYEAVKKGWSWPAFFFTAFWGLIKQIWIHSLVLLGIFISLMFVYSFGNYYYPFIFDSIWVSLFILMGILISTITFGINGNEWCILRFRKRGFKYLDSVISNNPKNAILYFKKISEEGQNISADNIHE